MQRSGLVQSAALRFVLALAAVGGLTRSAWSALSYTGAVTGLPIVQNSPTPVSLVGPNGSVYAGSVIRGSTEAFGPAHGLNTGVFTSSFYRASAFADDIYILGPAGAPVPFTMHIPFHANITQNWTAITFQSFTELSQPSNATDLSASLFSPLSGSVSGRFILRNLADATNHLDLTTSQTAGGSVVPTGHYPAPEIISAGGITLFKNVPVDGEGGYLNMTRTQIPVIDNDNPYFGDGVGLSYQDLVELRGEILLTGMAQAGTRLQLTLVASGDATASGSSDQSAFAELDARSTFGPPQDGSPVFDLPAGYTAESESLNIINNAAPEPAALSLEAAGATLLLAFRRRHAARS